MIHIIGNSHVNNFSFSDTVNFNHSLNPNFKLYHLGPVIAYNFYEHHFPKVKHEILPQINKETDYLLIIVGEVDCRLHLPLKADELKKSDNDMVFECVQRMSRIYNELKEYKSVIISTHPTTTESHNMEKHDRPIYDSCQRRNKICLLWNKYQKEVAEKYNIPYISIYEDLVDETNTTKMEYFIDYCHLSSKKIEPFLKREFKKIKIDI